MSSDTSHVARCVKLFITQEVLDEYFLTNPSSIREPSEIYRLLLIARYYLTMNSNFPNYLDCVEEIPTSRRNRKEIDKNLSLLLPIL